MFSTIADIAALFSKKERMIFIGSFFVFIVASLLLTTSFIGEKTELVPKEGGEYAEGVVGQPMFINPLFAENNSTDNDLSHLLFADMGTLSEKMEIGDDKKTYDIRIKPDLRWQDGQPITSDDVMFTIKLIQDPDVNSVLASFWKGVQVERVSERELRVITPATYAFFEETLRSLRPIPKHLFETIPSANIRISGYNLEPIGSGPYKFTSFAKRRDGFITQIVMDKDARYAGEKPYIGRITMKFYADESSAVRALDSGDIDGTALTDPNDLNIVSIPRTVRKIAMPRYYAVFLNPYANPMLKDADVRKALDLGTDKNAIVKTVFGDTAITIEDPIPPFTSSKGSASAFSADAANALLDKTGWAKGNDGIRTKNGKRLSFVLTVYPSPFLSKTADLLKEQWKAIGIDLTIVTPQLTDFGEEVLKPRNYEMLAFGNIYGRSLDPFSFWHSSQKLAPGLNLSLFENSDADKLIASLRGDFDPQSRANGMRQLAPIITAQNPAVFLYSPYYLYVSNKSLKGFDVSELPTPSDRFSDIARWYVKTSRKFK